MILRTALLYGALTLAVSLGAAEAPANPIDQKATTLEGQLNKALDTSPEGARVMLELVDLYHLHARVFGLTRVSERFVKAQPNHARHREVMLKLLDGLEVAARHEDFAVYARQYLTRYPDSADAQGLAHRLGDLLVAANKHVDAADAFRTLWANRPGPATREAGQRASELYVHSGNPRLRTRVAQIAEEMHDKLPAGEFTLHAGLRGFADYRTLGRWSDANLLAQKMLRKGLPLTRHVQRTLQMQVAENFAHQGQFTNALESLKLARALGDDADLAARQISYMYSLGIKPAQLEPEVQAYLARHPQRRDRAVQLYYLAHAYNREGDALRGARVLVPALVMGANEANVADIYAQFILAKAMADRQSAQTTLDQAQAAAEAARKDETDKRAVLAKTVDANAKKAAQDAVDAALKVRLAAEAQVAVATQGVATAQNALNQITAEADQTLTAALNQSTNPVDKLACRFALSRGVWLAVKNEANSLAHARAALLEFRGDDTRVQTLGHDLLWRQPMGPQFAADAAVLLRLRQELFTAGAHLNLLPNWVAEANANKDHRPKAQQVAAELVRQDASPLFQSLIRYGNYTTAPNAALPLRETALGAFNELSRETLLSLVKVQRDTLLHSTAKPDPVRAHALATRFYQRFPQEHMGVYWLMTGTMADKTKAEARAHALLLMALPPKRDYELHRSLMQAAEINQDAALAAQVYDWAIRGGISTVYSDYIGDMLWKLNLKTQALDWWKRVVEAPSEGQYAVERTCAERYLRHSPAVPAPWRELAEYRWPELRARMAAQDLTDVLRLQGNVAAFAEGLARIESQQREVPFANPDWRETAGLWWDFTTQNAAYTLNNKEYKKLDVPSQQKVLASIQDVQCRDYSAYAACEVMLAHNATAGLPEPPMTTLLRLSRATRQTHNDHGRWNNLRSFAQRGFEQKRFTESATLLSGMLVHISNVPKEVAEEGRKAVLRAHTRMGAVGLTIDESSPMAPLLQATLYLRLGDRNRAMEQFTANTALFDKHRTDLPPDFLEFACNHLMAGGGEENLARVEETLRTWLVRFTDPDKPESREQTEDAKARLQLLLARSYIRGQRYEVARVEFSTVTNRYAGTPHAIEARFGIGEAFMAQRIYDQAALSFKELEENPDLTISIRAQFLTGLLAFRQDQREEARDLFQRILERVPDVELANRTLFSLSEIYGLEQRYLEQLNLLRTVGRLGQHSKRLHTPGRALSFVVHDRDLGVSRGQSRIPVIVTTRPGGDREMVYLQSAAGAGKGLFRGEVATALGAAAAGDGVLQLTGKDVIESDYPAEFKAQFRTVPLSDVEIRVAADAEFAAASSEISDEERETLTQRLRREQQTGENVDNRRSQGRPQNQVKPGNRVFLRVKDADRDLGNDPDRVLVKLQSSSGDQVQIELMETGPHTGMFNATIATAELPAGAAATDAAIDHSPLMAIDHSRDTYWQSAPDGATPKLLTVDMKHLHDVGRVRVSTPSPAEHAPVRGSLLGSHDGVYWFTLASQPPRPRADFPAAQSGGMTRRVFTGDYTGYKTWAQVAALGRAGKVAAESNATELSWRIEAGQPGANQPHAVMWHGKLVQAREGALRVDLSGDLVALAVDGVVEILPAAGPKSADVWLRAGLHDVAVFVALKTAQSGATALRARSNLSSSVPRPSPFVKGDFDLQDAARLFGGAGATQERVAGASVVADFEKQVSFTKKTPTFGLVPGSKPEVKWVGNWSALEDVLQWKVAVAQPGVYELWLNLAHAAGGTRFRAQWGDQIMDGIAPNTGSWQTFQQQKIGSLHVEEAGEKTLLLTPLDLAGGPLMVLGGIELRPAAGATVVLRDRAWEFFFDPLSLRYVRFQVDEYTGDSVAVNHVEVRGPQPGAPLIPTKEDVSTLAKNGILEIAGGDSITVSYTDETAIATQGGSRLLSTQLTATYHDASVVPISFDFNRDNAGGVQQFRKEQLRLDPGERVTFEIADYDMDQTGQRDTVPVTIWLNGQKWAELNATETEDFSGTFRIECDTSAAPAPGKITVKPGDRIFCRYRDVQNTFPGHSVDREGLVMVTEPSAARIRFIETRLVRPPAGVKGAPQPVYLPEAQVAAEDSAAQVNYHVPLTIEVIDPDAAKDSRSRVRVRLDAGTTNAVDVWCELSTQFSAMGVADPGQMNPALLAGRFIGQVRMQLGGADSPTRIPRVLGDAQVLLGQVRASGEKPEAADDTDRLLYTVLNLTGNATATATYADDRRPEAAPAQRDARARLSTGGTLGVTDEGYDKPVELLHVGEKLFIVVNDPDLDVSDDRDSAVVIVQSQSGEREQVRLDETLSHSGVFTAALVLRVSEKPTPGNHNATAREVECFFGDKLQVQYADARSDQPVSALALDLPVAVGTDGVVAAFSKVFGNAQLAAQTQFFIAESYFELFKNNLKLERREEADKALLAGRRILKEIMVDYPDPKHLPRIAYLSGQFAQELKDWNEAAHHYALIVRQHPMHTLAPDSQYKLAQCFEEAGDFDRALEEYITLAATYPKSPLVPNVMIRINEYFYKRKEYSIAAKVAEKFLDRFESHEHAPRMAFRWGQCHYKDDQFAKAAMVFDLFGKKFPDDGLAPEALFWSGESFRMANNVPLAFRRYNRCRWDYPESESAKYARGRLALPEMLAQFEREADLENK